LPVYKNSLKKTATGGSFMKKALLCVCFMMTALLVFAGGGGQSGGTSGSSGQRKDTWVTDRKVEFTWLMNNSLYPDDPNTTPFWQMMEEISNVHINWISVASDNWANYVNLMWAGGDYPDMASGLSNLPYYASQGVFFPINTLWEKDMPNLMKIFQAHPTAPAFLKYGDGNTYAFPGFEDNGIQMTNGMWIYKPWLDKLGLAVPTTLDEFVNVLQAFKTRDPNGNGIADEIPLTWGWGNEILGWFGASTDWLIRDAKAVYSPATENYKQYVQFMNRLWNLGLIDPEIYTQDSSTFDAKGRWDPPVYGVITHYGLYLVAGDSTYDDYILLAPVKTGTNPSGAYNGRYYKNEFMIFPDILTPTVFKNVKDPDTLLKWFDILYDPYYGSQVRFGKEGVHVKRDANNQFEQVFDPPAPYSNYSDWYFSTHYQIVTYTAREYCEPIFNGNREQLEHKKDDFYEPYFINEPMPMIAQLPEEAEKITGYPDIAKLVSDMTPQWIAGERDINRDWPDYLRQLEQLGLKDYTAAYQSYVTRVRNQLGSSY
jgi:putative aldouronate transport system substrate-binding protein